MVEHTPGEDELQARLRDLPTYPKLNSQCVPIEIAEDEIQFRTGPWAGPNPTVRDDDEEGTLLALVESLDGSNHVSDIVAEFGPDDDVVHLIKFLSERGIVTDGSESNSQLEYAVLKPGYGTESVEQVADSEIVLVNVGSIGRLVAQDLLEAGIGHIDVVEPDSPKRAVPSLADRDRVTTSHEVDRLPTLADSCDLLVYATNRPRPELAHRINEICQETGTTLTTGQIHGLNGLVGPTIIPGETACYACFKERLYSNVIDPETYVEYEDRDHRETTVTVAPLERIVAGYLTIDVTNVLCRGLGSTVGNVISYDFHDLGVEKNRVLKLPGCPVCGPTEETPQYHQLVHSLDFGGDSH